MNARKASALALLVPFFFSIESCLSNQAGESSTWNISRDKSDVVRKTPAAQPTPNKKAEEQPKAERAPEDAPPEKRTHSVSYSANGGIGAIGERHYEEGTLLVLAENVFVRPGHRFAGWNTSADGSGQQHENGGRITVSEDIVLYAQWERIPDPDFVRVEGASVGEIRGSHIFVRGRTVAINTFYLCNHEVTQSEYEMYCCYGERRPSDEDGRGADVPVYYTNWYDAIVYCNLRSMAEGREPAYSLDGERDPRKWAGVVSRTENGMTKYCGPASNTAAWNKISMNLSASGYRLPTEAEWEYAARGGKDGLRDSFTYAGGNALSAVAWFEENSSGKAHEVRTKAKNRLGIYDMSGNVWEWCWDWYAPVSAGTARTGAAAATNRVERGGDWFNSSMYCTVSYRLEDDHAGRDAGDGFRVVRNEPDRMDTLKR